VDRRNAATSSKCCFNLFRSHYNEERPHEALGQTPPAAHWQRLRRDLPLTSDEPWYDADHDVRWVRGDGAIKWHGKHIFIGEALAGEPVGLVEHDSGGHVVQFCRRDLSIVDRHRRFLRFAPSRARLRVAPEPPVTEEQ
jgi:hypothetical protein